MHWHNYFSQFFCAYPVSGRSLITFVDNGVHLEARAFKKKKNSTLERLLQTQAKVIKNCKRERRLRNELSKVLSQLECKYANALNKNQNFYIFIMNT